MPDGGTVVSTDRKRNKHFSDVMQDAGNEAGEKPSTFVSIFGFRIRLLVKNMHPAHIDRIKTNFQTMPQ